MTEQSSATLREATVLPRLAGLGWGLLGIVAFSFTLPFTRVAVGGLSPLFIGSGRAVVAAALAVIALSIARRRRPGSVPVPSPRQWARLAIGPRRPHPTHPKGHPLMRHTPRYLMTDPEQVKELRAGASARSQPRRGRGRHPPHREGDRRPAPARHAVRCPGEVEPEQARRSARRHRRPPRRA